MKLPIKSLSGTLFLDIETVSSAKELSFVDNHLQNLWQNKALHIRRYLQESEYTDAELYEKKAAIFAEFGKVICISVGIFKTYKDEIVAFRTRSFVHQDEYNLLNTFASFIQKHYKSPEKSKIVGHNIREFDVPYLCRRMLVNNIDLPDIFQLANKRPWQIKHIVDTMDLWRFGDYKHYVSLDLLAQILALPSPKESMSGEKVGTMFWNKKNLDAIVKYCERDVYTTAMVFLKLNSFKIKDLIPHKTQQLHEL